MTFLKYSSDCFAFYFCLLEELETIAVEEEEEDESLFA